MFEEGRNIEGSSFQDLLHFLRLDIMRLVIRDFYIFTWTKRSPSLFDLIRGDWLLCTKFLPICFLSPFNRPGTPLVWTSGWRNRVPLTWLSNVYRVRFLPWVEGERRKRGVLWNTLTSFVSLIYDLEEIWYYICKMFIQGDGSTLSHDSSTLV